MSRGKLPHEPGDFTERLAKARRGGSRKGAKREGPSGFGLALRISVELVAALAVGVGIGWLLDTWLGTTPGLMIVFFVLGSAAGMMNVYRTVSGIGHGVGYKPRQGDGNERG
jgi:ATP synthase protein I